MLCLKTGLHSHQSIYLKNIKLLKLFLFFLNINYIFLYYPINVTPCDPPLGIIKQLPFLADTKINVHGAVSDESNGTAILEQTLLDSFMSL